MIGSGNMTFEINVVHLAFEGVGVEGVCSFSANYFYKHGWYISSSGFLHLLCCSIFVVHN